MTHGAEGREGFRGNLALAFVDFDEEVDAEADANWRTVSLPLFTPVSEMHRDWYRRDLIRWQPQVRPDAVVIYTALEPEQEVFLEAESAATEPDYEVPAGENRQAQNALGRAILEQVHRRPSWILTRGIVVATLLLAASSCLGVVTPIAAPLGTASVLIVLGFTVLLDHAVRRSAVLNPRLALAMVVAGLGTFVVFIVGLVT
jgi:hypothetical protein